MLTKADFNKLDNSELIQYCALRAGKGTRADKELLIKTLCDRFTHTNMKLKSVLHQIHQLEVTLLCDTK